MTAFLQNYCITAKVIADLQNKMPTIDIAGLCLPLKPQKDRSDMYRPIWQLNWMNNGSGNSYWNKKL